MPDEDDDLLVAILLNYQTPKETVEAADALPDAVDQILIVENGSGDESEEVLLDTLEEPEPRAIQGGTFHDDDGSRGVLVLPENRGFTGGNNAGARAAVELWDPDHIYIQNPDARVPGPAIRRGVDLLRDEECDHVSFGSSPPSGGAGIQTIGRFPGPPKKVRPDLYEVKRASGMAQLFPRRLVDELHDHRGGLFGENLFLFFDELELGWLLHRWGRRQMLVLDEGVRHAVGSSTDTLDLPVKEYYTARNVQLVARRMPLGNRFVTQLASGAYTILEIGVHLLRRDVPRLRAVYEGFRDGLLGRAGQWSLHARQEGSGEAT